MHEKPKENKPFTENPHAMAATALLAAVGGAAIDRLPPQSTPASHEMVVGSGNAAKDLYAFRAAHRGEESFNGPFDEERKRLEAAALEELWVQYPGLKEAVIAGYGGEPEVGEDIVIHGTTGAPITVQTETMFVVRVKNKKEPESGVVVFSVFANEKGELDVELAEPDSFLSGFLPVRA